MGINKHHVNGHGKMGICFLKFLHHLILIKFRPTIIFNTIYNNSGTICTNHRLNGSSNHVLTATSLSYEKSQKFDPHRIKTPALIKIKFGMADYVGQIIPHAKSHVNLHKGDYSTNRWNIRKKFSSCTYTFFQKLTYRSDPSAMRWLKRRGLAQGCAFWKLKKIKLIFNVFIQKNPKNIMEPMGWFAGMANLMVSFNFTPGPSLVAMATKFGTKLAITRSV